MLKHARSVAADGEGGPVVFSLHLNTSIKLKYANRFGYCSNVGFYS